MTKLLLKQKDPGSFAILCSIGDRYVGRTLCDLGSSINLMPKSIFLKLGMGNAQPTTVILQLVDQSHVRPEGRIEDVIVKMDKFVFLDYEKREFTMRVTDQSVMINVFNTLKYVDDSEECHYIEDVDSLEDAGTKNSGQAVDYVSKWVEVVATPSNDSKIVLKLLHKNIFTLLGAPREIINDEGIRFNNKLIAKAQKRYGVCHRISMAYHTQTNGQAKVSNCEIKYILEKVVNLNRKDWSRKLEEAV
ncbi:uncharacterized protein LOC120155585 [Hibiscus syriacus]|uniref:uncharacterized protein LOC120155585 n=1 Tax=Hibiscus syriacus TaxID=106335 RepID=UPI001921B249|nr:uncharacterized protein LOC120155585 [Hibiscus syriacus]